MFLVSSISIRLVVSGPGETRTNDASPGPARQGLDAKFGAFRGRWKKKTKKTKLASASDFGKSNTPPNEIGPEDKLGGVEFYQAEGRSIFSISHPFLGDLGTARHCIDGMNLPVTLRTRPLSRPTARGPRRQDWGDNGAPDPASSEASPRLRQARSAGRVWGHRGTYRNMNPPADLLFLGRVARKAT